MTGRPHEGPLFVEDEQTHCWAWLLYCDPDGYGRIWDGTYRENRRANGRLNPRIVRAHRWMYEQLIGPMPEGMEIDHLCRNTSCVNPGHLEPVPSAENARRGKTAKLTWPAVERIRRAADTWTGSRRELARRPELGPTVSRFVSWLCEHLDPGGRGFARLNGVNLDRFKSLNEQNETRPRRCDDRAHDREE